MSGNKGIICHKGEGESYWVLGDLYTFKATGKQTNGAYTVVEETIQPQNGPPIHVHHREDEAFYVLEGRFSFVCGDEERLCQTGSFVYVPKGTAHTFKNIDEQPGKLLVTITPAGLEEFFYTIGTPAVDLSNPPAHDLTVMDRIMQLAEQYQFDVISYKRE
ncbi:quercetin 2,3-dioxygenase [Pontibacter korlensis]|uniref:Cupin type-2 domain-containing protein n=1 Tax=Pontibacter korlensis TaxID=400092 RepID=A0A0E3UXH4_9BACT|nr:quercetin 2,3-dioxygenase [Pontibacter korlensis]AKD04267.1 hypothetical protein PKOR_15690 [Pontibacter korlensis]